MQLPVLQFYPRNQVRTLPFHMPPSYIPKGTNLVYNPGMIRCEVSSRNNSFVKPRALQSPTGKAEDVPCPAGLPGFPGKRRPLQKTSWEQKDYLRMPDHPGQRGCKKPWKVLHKNYCIVVHAGIHEWPVSDTREDSQDQNYFVKG
jgi:hypothetical protein